MLIGGEDLSGLKLDDRKMRRPPWLSIDNKVVLIGALIGAVAAIVAAFVIVLAPLLLPKTPGPSKSHRSGALPVTPSARPGRHPGAASNRPVSGSGDGSSLSGLEGERPQAARRKTPTATAPSSQPSVSPSSTYPETVGGLTHTWTNYTNAGGIDGAIISAYATVQVSCRIQGFVVQDGDAWWYRIASNPWSNSFYASADAFYNNGAISGSLIGTPFVDTSVPVCKE